MRAIIQTSGQPASARPGPTFEAIHTAYRQKFADFSEALALVNTAETSEFAHRATKPEAPLPATVKAALDAAYAAEDRTGNAAEKAERRLLAYPTLEPTQIAIKIGILQERGHTEEPRLAADMLQSLLGAVAHGCAAGPRECEEPSALAAAWELRRDLLAAEPWEACATEVERELEFARVVSLETDILTGPILTNADVKAKLEAVALSFTDGNRGDNADAGAVAQVIRWLEAHA
jgi:hypothetical protein